MKYTKIIIDKSNEAYNIREELTANGITYDYKTKCYFNFYPIKDNSLKHIIWLSNKHNLTFKTEEVTSNIETDFNKYKILTIDKNNYIIEQKSNNLKCYYITIYNGMKDNIINILDIRESLHLKAILPEFKTNDNLFEVFKYFTFNKDIIKKNCFEKSKVFSILENFIETNTLDLKDNERLDKFKFMVIKDIINRNKGNFLCNCVPRFFPETSFTIVGSKIKSSYTKNFLPSNQEKKIWKYLIKKNNQKYIGKWKEVSNYQLFVGNKILVKDKNGSEYLAKIISVDKEYGGIKIKVTNGIQKYSVSKIYTKEELLSLIYEYNR